MDLDDVRYILYYNYYTPSSNRALPRLVLPWPLPAVTDKVPTSPRFLKQGKEVAVRDHPAIALGNVGFGKGSGVPLPGGVCQLPFIRYLHT